MPPFTNVHCSLQFVYSGSSCTFKAAGWSVQQIIKATFKRVTFHCTKCGKHLHISFCVTNVCIYDIRVRGQLKERGGKMDAQIHLLPNLWKSISTQMDKWKPNISSPPATWTLCDSMASWRSQQTVQHVRLQFYQTFTDCKACWFVLSFEINMCFFY